MSKLSKCLFIASKKLNVKERARRESCKSDV